MKKVKPLYRIPDLIADIERGAILTINRGEYSYATHYYYKDNKFKASLEGHAKIHESIVTVTKKELKTDLSMMLRHSFYTISMDYSGINNNLMDGYIENGTIKKKV